jgi:hypothetical protein
MSSAVVAAIIAAGASGLTLIVSVAAQIYGIRRTSGDTKEALKEQSEQLDRTLDEQRTRTLNERFATAADRLGSNEPPVRLAAVYAMAGLADDWEQNRQTCIDVLCAYLRMPYEPDPGPNVAADERLAFQGSREVRHTVMRVITEHLRDRQGPDERELPGVEKAEKQIAPESWQGLNFNFTGVVFDGGTFSDARFSSDPISRGGKVDFSDAEFRDDKVSFHKAKFSGGDVSFKRAKFSSGRVEFRYAKFSGGRVSFDRAEFSGGDVSFDRAEFSGCTVDFSSAADWSHPPRFDWEGAPPAGVKLPATRGETQ